MGLVLRTRNSMFCLNQQPCRPSNLNSKSCLNPQPYLNPKVCRIMAFKASFRCLGILFTLLLGSRDTLNPPSKKPLGNVALNLGKLCPKPRTQPCLTANGWWSQKRVSRKFTGASGAFRNKANNVVIILAFGSWRFYVYLRSAIVCSFYLFSPCLTKSSGPPSPILFT